MEMIEITIAILILLICVIVIFRPKKIDDSFYKGVGDLIVYYDDKNNPHFYLQVNEKSIKKIRKLKNVSLNVVIVDADFTSTVMQQ